MGEALTTQDIFRIMHALDDLNLPYCIDLSALGLIKHEELRKHIDRVGMEFYNKGKFHVEYR